MLLWLDSFKQTENVKMTLRERKSVNLRLVSSLGKAKQVFRGSEDFYGESFFNMMLSLERKPSQRSMRPSGAAQKEEERVSVKQSSVTYRGTPVFAEDMIGMGEASFGLHKEEDTLYNMQDYEGKKGRKIR
jgi:hypothetical protein